MILFGGFPGVLAFGPHGITPAGIAAAGNASSPLLNDVDAGDTTTELMWLLLAPLISTGSTQAHDDGGYALINPAEGTWLQHYRLFTMPASAAASVTDATITVTVGAVVTVSTGPRVAYFKDSGQVLPVLLDADGVPYAAKRPDGSLLTLRPIGGTMLGRASDDAGRIAILI